MTTETRGMHDLKLEFEGTLMPVKLLYRIPI